MHLTLRILSMALEELLVFSWDGPYFKSFSIFLDICPLYLEGQNYSSSNSKMEHNIGNNNNNETSLNTNCIYRDKQIYQIFHLYFVFYFLKIIS